MSRCLAEDVEENERYLIGQEDMLTWTTNRAVSIGLVPLTIMPFAAGSLNPILDGALIGLTIIHTYIGFG